MPPQKPTSQGRDVGHPVQMRYDKKWATRPRALMHGWTLFSRSRQLLLDTGFRER